MDAGARQLHSAHQESKKNPKPTQTTETPKPTPIMVKLFIHKNKHPPSTKSKSESNICLLVRWLLPARMVTTWHKLSSNGCEPEPAGTQCKTLPVLSPMRVIQFSLKPKGAPYGLQQTLDGPHRPTVGTEPWFTVSFSIQPQKPPPEIPEGVFQPSPPCMHLTSSTVNSSYTCISMGEKSQSGGITGSKKRNPVETLGIAKDPTPPN